MFNETIPLPDTAATEKLAAQLAPRLRRGDVLALQGPLGAGKTTFARGLLNALGIRGDVPSPTFTLLQTYDAPDFPVYHFDLYRLKNSTELDELGWDDALADGLTLVEWPERAGNRLPDNHLVLHFMVDERGQHTCLVESHDDWSSRLKKTG